MLNIGKMVDTVIDNTLNPFIVNSDFIEFVYFYQQMIQEELGTYGLTVNQLGVFSNIYHIYMIWGITWDESGEKFIRLTWKPDGKNGSYEIYNHNPQ